MSDRIRFIPNPVSGKNVLLIDLSGFSNTLESLPYIAEARAIVGKQAPQSLCCIVDVTGSRFNVKVVEAMKELATHNKPFVIASALVGVSGLQRVILESVITFSGRTNLKSIATRATAFAWLAAQAPPL